MPCLAVLKRLPLRPELTTDVPREVGQLARKTDSCSEALIHGGPEILKGGGAEGNVSAPSHFIENARNELYTFYMGKGDLLKQMLRPIRVRTWGGP